MKFRDKIFQRINRSRILTNITGMASATLFSQVITLIALPVLMKLFSPEAFGIAGLFATYAGFLVAFSTFRMEWTIPSANNDRDAFLVAKVATYICITISVMAFLVVWMLGDINVFGDVGELVYLIPLLSMLMGFSAIVLSVLTRQRNMVPVSRARYIFALTNASASVSAGFAGVGPLGLILSNILATLLEIAVRLTCARKLLIEIMRAELSWSWLHYKYQYFQSTVVSVINFTYLGLIPVLLSAAYSPREVGFYFVSLRIISAPVSFVSSSISASFWGEAAKLANTDLLALRKLYLRAVSYLLVLAIPFSFAVIIASFFIQIFFDQSEWVKIATVSLCLIPQAVGTLVFSSTNHLIVYSKQIYQILSDGLSIICNLLIFYLAVLFDLEFFVTIFLMSSSTLIFYLVRFSLHLKANTEVQEIGSL